MDQYRDILESCGKRMEDCKILAFNFDSDLDFVVFHYELTYPTRPKYYIFDSVGSKAIVVIPKDPENEQMMIEFAESCNGKKTTPNLI